MALRTIRNRRAHSSRLSYTTPRNPGAVTTCKAPTRRRRSQSNARPSLNPTAHFRAVPLRYSSNRSLPYSLGLARCPSHRWVIFHILRVVKFSLIPAQKGAPASGDEEGGRLLRVSPDQPQ